jgi:hypothetical protein
MAIVGAIAAVAGAGAAVVGTVQAGKAQRRAAQEQQKQQELSNRRQQRAAIREGQIRRAQGLASAQAMGVAGSSVSGGGAASIGSQVGSTLGFSSQMSGLSSNITDLTQKAATWSSVAQIGGSIYQAANGPKRLENLIGQ